MTTKKTGNGKSPVKPYVTGSPFDESTPKSSLLFFGSLLLVAFMCFLVSAATGGAAGFFRVLLNGTVIAVVLLGYFSSGESQGTEAVTRGEILYQRREKGLPFTDSEKKMCFHKAKGFLTAFLGTLPLFLAALLLAVMTKIQTTDSGALPSWVQGYLGREEIGGALIHYSQPAGMTLVDYLRLIIRIVLLPWVNIPGSSNKVAMLWTERLSPLLVILPAVSFGFGYLTGTSNRIKIHRAISESTRRRANREKKARKARLAGEFRRKGPEQLN